MYATYSVIIFRWICPTSEKQIIEKFNISLNSQPKHFPPNTPFGGAEYFRSLKNQITRLFYFSPQSRRNFGERLIKLVFSLMGLTWYFVLSCIVPFSWGKRHSFPDLELVWNIKSSEKNFPKVQDFCGWNVVTELFSNM